MIISLRPKLYSIWTPIIFFSIIRIFVAPTFELGVDEAHYLLYAKHLSLSYFDHPPLVGWLHVPLSLFNTNELTARLPAIFLGAWITYFSYKLVLMQTHSKEAALWGSVALNTSFIFGALFLMLMPDTILIFFLFLLIFAFVNILEKQTFLAYFLFGLILGLCGMAKYTAILLTIGVIAYIIETRKFDVLFSKFTPITIATAMLVISPVIIWNLQNSFASFSFQSSHVAGGNSLSINTLLKNITSQFGAYSPPLFIIAIYGLLKSYKSRNASVKISFWIGVVLLIFFAYTESSKAALPHWISPFFALFIPYGVAVLFLSNKTKIVKYSVLFSLIITLAVYSELVLKIGKFEDLKSPFRDIYGWRDASKKLVSIKREDTDIAVINWSEASRVSLYSGETVFVADSRRDQFDIWYQKEPTNHNYIFLIAKSSKTKLDDRIKCSSYLNLGNMDAKLNGGIVEGFEFIQCNNYQGLKK